MSERGEWEALSSGEALRRIHDALLTLTEAVDRLRDTLDEERMTRRERGQ